MPAASRAMQQKRESSKSSARKEARISPEQKQVFERAAQVEGVTLTDFAVSSMQRAATRVLQEHAMILLSQKDQQAFVDVLMNPPQPNAALRQAAKRYLGAPEYTAK